MTVDSGASDTVIPPHVARRVPMLHSSKVGTEYEVANGEVIEMFWEKHVVLNMTTEGNSMAMTFQVAEVHKPLLAVSRIVEAGNQVLFGLHPHILLANGTKLPMKCNGGTHEVTMWVKNAPERASESAQSPGFNRQSHK